MEEGVTELSLEGVELELEPVLDEPEGVFVGFMRLKGIANASVGASSVYGV